MSYTEWEHIPDWIERRVFRNLILFVGDRNDPREGHWVRWGVASSSGRVFKSGHSASTEAAKKAVEKWADHHLDY